MADRDHYYNKAKQEGYRSRATYKLLQIDETFDLFSSGDRVVDLGAAPGGWLQAAAEAVGETGTVVGVDFQRIDALQDAAATIETVRGDVTDPSTVETVRERLPEGRADVVLSDMAPDMTGEYALDHARSAHLAEQAFEIAETLLVPGGHLVVKIFQGEDTAAVRERLEEAFEYVQATSPDASRDSSAEIYLIGNGYVDAPIEPGDRVTVRIDERGTEGDGIAKVEGYTIFIPGTDVGEEVDIVVTDVKPRYAFAEKR